MNDYGINGSYVERGDIKVAYTYILKEVLIDIASILSLNGENQKREVIC